MTATYTMAEALLQVPDLRAWIKERKAAGASYEAIAREIWETTDHKVSVSLYTIRRWDKEAVA